MRTRGFTLIEVLLSLAIVVIVMGLFVGILATSAKVQLRQSALSEVSNQANFVIQTIQRLVRESSAAFVNCSETETVQDDDVDETLCSNNPQTGQTMVGKPQRFLRLRMPDSPDNPLTPNPRDPIVIWAENGSVKMQERAPQGPIRNLTTDRITCTSADCLTFTKYTNYPGRDHIEINLTLTSAGDSNIKRELVTSISRASAATFDSGVFPGPAGTFDLGSQSDPWQDLYVDAIKGTFQQPDNFTGLQRGYFTVFAAGKNCSSVCSEHGLTCNSSWTMKLEYVGAAGVTGGALPNFWGLNPAACSYTPAGSFAGYCACQKTNP